MRFCVACDLVKVAHLGIHLTQGVVALPLDGRKEWEGHVHELVLHEVDGGAKVVGRELPACHIHVADLAPPVLCIAGHKLQTLQLLFLLA